MGIIVYVSNKPFVSDFNALQLEPARIHQMSLSNPTAGGLSPPTIWQPPLPTFAPPPLPTSASIPTTPVLTQPTTQYLYDDPNDPYQQFPVRRINYDSSLLTPTSTRPLDPSIVYGTPPYHQAQHMPRTPGFQPFFSGYPAVTSFGTYSRTVTKSPSEYIRAGIPANRGTIMPPSASAYPLSCDEFGQQYTSLQAAAAARGRDLHSIFTAYGMNYPYVPVDRDLTEFPLLLTNPITTSATEKLHHQTERILKYFQRAAQQRDGTFRLDHLGELAYQDGRCELYHQHAARLLEALRAVDLLKVVTAIVAGNFVLTIDEASTSLPRQALDDIIANMLQHSYLLNGSVTPLCIVSWEYLSCTPRNAVTTVSAIQLTKMTNALLDSLSRFLQRDTLRAITGDITSGLHRQIDPTLLEILHKLLMYEETEWKHALRRQHLKRTLFQPLDTNSTQQAENMWKERKRLYGIVFQTPAFPFIIEEFKELIGCLPPSLRQHADTLQEYYALNDFPSDIGDVFKRLRSLCDSSALNRAGRSNSKRPNSYSVSFAGQHRDRGRHRPNRYAEREYEVTQHRPRNHRSGHDTGHRGDGHRREDRGRSEHSRGRSRYDNHPRERDLYRSRSRSRSMDSLGSQRSDVSRDYAHSRSRSPGDRSGWNDDRDRRGRSDRLDRDHRGRASSLDLATRRLREREQGLDRVQPDRDRPRQDPARQRTPPASPRGQSTAELNAVQQTPPVKVTVPPRRSQSPSQARPNPTPPRTPSPRKLTPDDIQREKRRQALRLQQAKVAAMEAEIEGGNSTSRISVVFTSLEHTGQSTPAFLGRERISELPAFDIPECSKTSSSQVLKMTAPETDPGWDQLSDVSRLRRRALLEQKLKRDSIDIPTADKCTALQNMLRVHDNSAGIHHISKIDGCQVTLVDPGAQVSATSEFNMDQCITVIDTNDRVDLQSFTGNREQLLCLGSTLRQIISQTTSGALTVFIFKDYILKGKTSIDIMSIHELEAAGGSAHFGTNDELRIKQTVDGIQYEYVYTNGEAILISPLSGGVEMIKKQRLHYLASYNPSLFDSRQTEINSLLADVRSVYSYVEKDALAKSYSVALEMAIGRQQTTFAVSALNYQRSLPMFPPNLNLYDVHETHDSLANPVLLLRDSFARVQAHAAKFDGDEHQEQRDVLLQQIETSCQELEDLSPTLSSIGNLRIGSNYAMQRANQISLEFNGTDLADTAGPAPFIEPFDEPITTPIISSATINLTDPENNSSHSSATRTPASIQLAGMFSPDGLKVAIVQTAAVLALYALVNLTVFPDSTIDVFSNATASEIYSCVPVAQRHRVFLHRCDPRTLTITTMQLALQDHDRTCRRIDVLHVEDLDPNYSHDNYELLRQKITEFNPDLLCTFRNHFEDRTLGSKLNGSMRYLIEQPTAIRCIKMVPTVRQGSKDKSVTDQDSVQLDWIEHVLGLFEDYITNKYNVPICTGLFLYEDLAEMALANLDASDFEDGDTSSARQCASTLVTTGEPQCGDVWKHPFHTPSATRLSATKRSFDTVSSASSHQIEKNSIEFAASTMDLECASTLVTTGGG